MVLFIGSIILGGIAVFGSLVGYSYRKADPDLAIGFGIASGVLTLFAVILLVVSCISTVGTSDIGVETAFGHTEGDLGPGLHIVAPWYNVTTLDGAIQTDSYTGAQCLDVRVANQQTACADVSIRWRLKRSDADVLFKSYRTFAKIQDSLVTRELTSAVNTQLADYNPLNSVEGSTYANPPLSVIAADITRQMQREIGDQGIDVLNTIMPIITFDPQTQARINQLQQQVALTRIAEQAELTNVAQAKANNAISESISKDPNVLKYDCLNDLAEMVKNGQTVPAGFDCGLGSGVSGVIASTR